MAEYELIPYVGTRTPADMDSCMAEVEAARGNEDSLDARITAAETAIEGKQGTLTFDSAPTEDSSNPVTSGGLYTALAGKQSTLSFDDAPTSSSSNPVKSGGVYTALAGKQPTLTTAQLNAANSGATASIINAAKTLTGADLSGQVFASGTGWVSGVPAATLSNRNYVEFTSSTTRISSPRVSTAGADFLAISVENGYKIRVLFWQSTGEFVANKQYAFIASDYSDLTAWYDEARIIRIPPCAAAFSVTVAKHSNTTIETSDYVRVNAVFIKKEAQPSAIKSGVFLGDSISFGMYSYWSGTSRKNADDVTGIIGLTKTSRRISDWFGYFCGTEITNLAARGTGYVADTRSLGNALEVAGDTDFTQYDFVALCFGVNDYIQGSTIGTDQTSAEGTIAGNLALVLQKIYTDNPLAKVVVFTPYNTWGQWRDTQGATQTLYGDESSNYALGHEIGGNTLQDVVDVIHTVCDYYGVEVVDLSKGNVINRLNIKDVLVDGLHPREDIMDKLASEMYANMTYN